jgi:hypothetical protein
VGSGHAVSARYFREVEALAAEFGAVVEWDHRTHGKIRHPSGWQVAVSKSPSDDHAIDQVRRDCRRKARGVYR